MTSQAVPPAQRILVDIDSTLYPSDPIFVRGMREMYGIRLRIADMTEWGWWARYITLDEFLALIREYFHSEREIASARAFPDAVAALRDWRAAGARVHIVSDRHKRTTPATVAWLDASGIERDTVVLRSGIDKVSYALSHKIGLIIDDKPLTLENARQAGIRTATLSLPYNRPLLAAAPEIIRASNWRVLRRRIEEDAARHRG
jgi:uncharacterized HAD superfamily protein